MSIDFRAQNIQTEKIIVTGDPDSPGDRTQLVIYPIQSQGSPPNQGDIGDTGLAEAIQGTDVFMYVSGSINSRGGSTKGITVFGGDLHVSGNFSVDGSGGGGSGGSFIQDAAGTTKVETEATADTVTVTAGGTVVESITTDTHTMTHVGGAAGSIIMSTAAAGEGTAVVHAITDGSDSEASLRTTNSSENAAKIAASTKETSTAIEVQAEYNGNKAGIDAFADSSELSLRLFGDINLYTVPPVGTPLSDSILWRDDNGNLRTGTVSGGSSYTGPFPYAISSSSLGTPIITGTITGGVTVADVSGSAFGGVIDFVQIVATDPQAGSFVQIPITLPVTPLPDNFGVNIQFFTGAPPADNFQSGLAFIDSTGDRFWEIFHAVEVSSSTRPAIKILELDTFVIGASWDFPDLGSMSNAVDIEAVVTKVSPFAAIPQVQFDVTARNFSVHSGSVTSKAVAANKTTGTISAGWAGEDFFGAQIVLVFTSTMVGAVNLFAAVEFVPTIRDLY